MADNEIHLTDEEREEQERRRREGKPALDEEIVRKYDTDRLAKIVARGGGRGEHLDLATRSSMENRLPGYDFSKVRVFRGALAEEITEKHKADAITIANTGMILMRESPRSAPGTRSGEALLAHELTHVAQAQRGMQFARERDHEGEGEHEQEAREVEREHEGEGHPQESDEGNFSGRADKGAQMRKMEARHQKIVERVIEMLGEDDRMGKWRAGVER